MKSLCLDIYIQYKQIKQTSKIRLIRKVNKPLIIFKSQSYVDIYGYEMKHLASLLHSLSNYCLVLHVIAGRIQYV